MKILRILVDMDGVLADFERYAFSAHGVGPATMLKYREVGKWDIGAAGTMSHDYFWVVINTLGESFWESIPPMSWINELISDVGQIAPWWVVSAPSQCHTSHSGKVKWLKQHIGPRFDKFLLTRYKEILAQPGVVLIDDREENIDKFVKYGGHGIIFPTIGNSLYSMRDEPLRYVREELYLLQHKTEYPQVDFTPLA